MQTVTGGTTTARYCASRRGALPPGLRAAGGRAAACRHHRHGQGGQRPLVLQGPHRLVGARASPGGDNSTNDSQSPQQQSKAAGAAVAPAAPSPLTAPGGSIEGPSTDLSVIYERFSQLVLPYWREVPGARWKLAGVVALTLGTTGVSVLFNFLGRDFFNALAERDVDAFQTQLFRYLGGFAVGVPVFVIKRYFQSCLALEWREWMTSQLLSQYFRDRSFYQLQAGQLVDNPDQRIAADVRTFTDTALSLSLTTLNSLIDLVSFSGILYSIYPPLFVALLAYSIGGTGASIYLGKNLVALNFNQEAREADLRYGLVRVRENAESIAFFGGEGAEMRGLSERLREVLSNYSRLLVSSRNLDLFTSFYRFVIQLLPAAVVAPLYFQNKIEFGSINQAQSAFNHILSDVSLVVYQFEALAGFSAVVDRLGQFREVSDIQLRHVFTVEGDSGSSSSSSATAAPGDGMAAPAAAATGGAVKEGAAAGEAKQQKQQQRRPTAASADAAAEAGAGGITIVHLGPSAAPTTAAAAAAAAAGGASPGAPVLLELRDLSISTPDGSAKLAQHLNVSVRAGESLLIVGPSGAGKTSVLRALAGLWQAGSGSILSYGLPGLGDPGCHPGSVLFLPQKPYMILGSLRDQLLYPTWSERGDGSDSTNGGSSSGVTNGSSSGVMNGSIPPPPDDAALEEALRRVQLTSLLERCRAAVKAAAAASAAPAAEPGPSHAGGSAEGAAAAAAAAGNGSSSSGKGGSGGGSGISGGGASSSPLDCVADWSQLLSLGEQQRLAFARLLLTAPRLALLDEATSALDTKNEALLYQAVLDAGVTLISVGHRPTLVRFHDRVLQLGPSRGPDLGADWSLCSPEEYAEAAAAVV